MDVSRTAPPLITGRKQTLLAWLPARTPGTASAHNKPSCCYLGTTAALFAPPAQVFVVASVGVDTTLPRIAPRTIANVPSPLPPPHPTHPPPPSRTHTPPTKLCDECIFPPEIYLPATDSPPPSCCCPCTAALFAPPAPVDVAGVGVDTPSYRSTNPFSCVFAQGRTLAR